MVDARAKASDSSNDDTSGISDSPILALLDLAILHGDIITSEGTGLVGEVLRRLLLALAPHPTQPAVAKAIVVYILALERSLPSISKDNSGMNRGVVVLSLLSSTLCHLRQDSFDLATTTSTSAATTGTVTSTSSSSPLSIDVVERMTSLALVLVTDSHPTPSPSSGPGSDAAAAAAQGLALLARRLPPSTGTHPHQVSHPLCCVYRPLIITLIFEPNLNPDPT